MRDRGGSNMEALAVILVIFACIVAMLGLLLMSQATAGVGVIGVACLLAILARLAQAQHHHQEAMRALHRPTPATWLCFHCGQHVSGQRTACPTCATAQPRA